MTSDFAQPFEHADQMLVAIVDETYGVTEGDVWEQEREIYRLGLEAEFGLPFEDADIGPGASLPAFVTLLQTATVPVWPLLVAAFFLGKPINENLSAWHDIGQKIRSFFKRPVYLNRQGAVVVAIEAVFEAMGGLPKSVRLISYRTIDVTEPYDLAAMECNKEIGEALPTLFLGFIRHIFEIEADGVLFRVGIDGKDAKVLRLD